MNRQSLKKYFVDNLYLIFFVAANTAALTLIFIISGPSLMLRAKQAYTAFDALQYYIYTIALISWIGLAHLLFLLALKKMVRSFILCTGVSVVWHFLLFFIAIADIKQIKLYPFELLKKNGYTLYGATSSQLLHFSKQTRYVVNQLDVYREFLRTSDYEKEYDLVEWARETYAAHDKNKPFFMFIFLNATHHNYYFPPEFEKYKPVMAADYNHFLGDDKLVFYKDQIFNRYKNASLFIDHLAAMLFDIFKPEIDAGNLIVSVTGDHGEEFWDRGGLGHAQTKFINPRISVPLLLCLPAQGHHEIALSSEAILCRQ